MTSPDPTVLLEYLSEGRRRERIRHVEREQARAGITASWPTWLDDSVADAFARTGVHSPWLHQVQAADLAHAGNNVVLATGTGSGKSIGYLTPTLDAVVRGSREANGRGATALYISPTKALAHDQLRALSALELLGLRATSYDGDTPDDERAWARSHANFVVTNPDMLHRAILPAHHAWASFFRALSFVIVDETHAYRGVFGSHVALILRRLDRVARLYKSSPRFLFASATTGSPAQSCTRMLGQDVLEVTEDTSPRGERVIALWEPPLTDHTGEQGGAVRRTASAETADVLADLVVADARSLAFIRSRRGAEGVALTTRSLLTEVSPGLEDKVAAYRAGYLPEERRALEHQLRAGDLLAVATTNALELGIDISGLDAVIVAGWPGTRASLRQQMGRAGRAGAAGLGIFIARDDPLDAYLVSHPDAIFGRAVETTVCDPSNPYILGPHLCAAAAEQHLTDEDLARFGDLSHVRQVLDDVVAQGLLRKRPTGWYWTDRSRAADLADLRGTGGNPVRVIEQGTGRLLGTVDNGAAHSTVHEGAVYIHQGDSWLVRRLDLDDCVAEVERVQVDHSTHARSVTDVAIVTVREHADWGPVRMHVGTVDVSSQVVSFLRRRVLTGEVLGEEPLDLPERTLRTTGVWWTIPASVLTDAAIDDVDVPGAAHAAEHAAIGLLPLFATCDRWDIGGVSTAHHPDTGTCTIFVHDGHPGGAGFAKRGYHVAAEWLTATRDAIASCECATGCPSCVQSPKCGNGNNPLDKAAAMRLLTAMLAEVPTQPAPVL